MKYWNSRWSYVKQHRQFVLCNVDQVAVSNKWSARPNSNGMEQVKELLSLMNHKNLDGVIMVMNFIFRRIQPYKERVHRGYEFRGETDSTREVPEQIERDEVLHLAEMLFNTVAHIAIKGPQRAFNITNPPLMVIICLTCILLL